VGAGRGAPGPRPRGGGEVREGPVEGLRARVARGEVPLSQREGERGGERERAKGL